jgi:hypothetical protein
VLELLQEAEPPLGDLPSLHHPAALARAEVHVEGELVEQLRQEVVDVGRRSLDRQGDLVVSVDGRKNLVDQAALLVHDGHGGVQEELAVLLQVGPPVDGAGGNGAGCLLRAVKEELKVDLGQRDVQPDVRVAEREHAPVGGFGEGGEEGWGAANAHYART